jgi:hypothetical protein
MVQKLLESTDPQLQILATQSVCWIPDLNLTFIFCKDNLFSHESVFIFSWMEVCSIVSKLLT